MADVERKTDRRHGWKKRPDRARPGLLSAARPRLVYSERLLALDGGRTVRNLRESARLLLLALVVAVLMGAAARAFLGALDLVGAARDAHPAAFALLPLVGVLTAWLYRTRGLQASRGNNLVIDSVFSGRLIHLRMAALTFCCSTATHLAGGSAGREGAAVQIGGTIASNVSKLFHLDGHDHRDLMLAGISAAFGAVFGAPLAGTFFGMEMCFVGKLDYGAALYCLAASFAADATARALGAAHERLAIATVPACDPRTVAVAVLAAVAFGIAARAFAFSIRALKRFYAHRFRSYLAAALTGALVLLAAFALLGGWRYAGLSTWMQDAGFRGATGPADVASKFVLTVLTLGAGFQGGEVTPLFGMGAALGGWIGCVAGTDPSFLAALGLLGMFGAGLNVPVTTVMLGIDLFGGAAAPWFALTAFTSYLVAGHRGVYPAQRIVTPKRRSLEADASLTVDEAIARHREAVEREVEEVKEEAEEAESARPAGSAAADGTGSDR